MKDNLSKIVFILDRSGSMASLTSDTIGGYNSFIEKQKQEPGDALLTTVLFDDKYEILHDNVPIQQIKPLTTKEYYARGMTALLDAIGKTINTVGGNLGAMDEAERPSKVIFVITTDGLENSSHEFSWNQIKDMIKHQTEKYSWQFIFLGANIDSASTAESMGINAPFASNYRASAKGSARMFSSVSDAVGSYRSMGKIKKEWAASIKPEDE